MNKAKLKKELSCLVDSAAMGISNLTVQAFDAGLIRSDDTLGLALTDANGYFEINYSSEYFIQRVSTLNFDKKTDIYFIIYKDGKLIQFFCHYQHSWYSAAAYIGLPLLLLHYKMLVEKKKYTFHPVWLFKSYDPAIL